jgi:hypothetical protein
MYLCVVLTRSYHINRFISDLWLLLQWLWRAQFSGVWCAVWSGIKLLTLCRQSSALYGLVSSYWHCAGSLLLCMVWYQVTDIVQAVFCSADGNSWFLQRPVNLCHTTQLLNWFSLLIQSHWISVFPVSPETSPVTRFILEQVLMKPLQGFKHIVWTYTMRRLAVLVGKFVSVAVQRNV